MPGLEVGMQCIVVWCAERLNRNGLEADRLLMGASRAVGRQAAVRVWTVEGGLDPVELMAMAMTMWDSRWRCRRNRSLGWKP